MASAFWTVAAFDQKIMIPSEEETGRRNGGRALAEAVLCSVRTKDRSCRLTGTAEPASGFTSETRQPVGSES